MQAFSIILIQGRDSIWWWYIYMSLWLNGLNSIDFYLLSYYETWNSYTNETILVQLYSYKDGLLQCSFFL